MTTAPARLYGPNGQPVNGHKAADMPKRAAATPTRAIRFADFHLTPPPAPTVPEPVAEHAHAEPVQPVADPIAEAEAEAIRLRAEAEAEARRIAAEAEANAIETKAEEEKERLRIANERAAMRLEKERVDHEAYKARKAKETARDQKEKEQADQADAEEAAREAQRAHEQARSEQVWKWGARAIYAVGLLIAAPIQFLAFWDPHRPFLVAAPALLEGLALALACGAAWAVAHRRDVLPYRIGIMIGACVAAGINMWHGMSEPAIGFNAGLIGAIASLGGPIVLMAYEHGIAQKADGIPSGRERRATTKAAAAAKAERDKAKADKKTSEEKAAADKKGAEDRARAEQERKDADRAERHPDVWDVAESLRSARGSVFVTEQIWSEAWYRVTGSKLVGIRPEIEALSRAAQERMKSASEGSFDDAPSQIESQMSPAAKRDPNTPDGRRFNGGVPPLRRPGDTAPYTAAAKKQAAIAKAVSNQQKED